MTLTPETNTKLDELAAQYSLSRPALDTLLAAIIAGNGKMAQFSHPDLGGSGQWMAGGMTMVGDMFNHSLRARVAAVCEALAGLVGRLPAAAPENIRHSFSSRTAWWPDELGTPAQAGGQNASRYAIFPAARRVAILENGQCSVYDTLDYTVTGVSQQQGGTASMILGTDRGSIALSALPVVSEGENSAAKPSTTPSGNPRSPDTVPSGNSQSWSHSFASSSTSSADPVSAGKSPESTGAAPVKSSRAASDSDESESILRTIERLAELRDKSVITEDEFSAKKAELLSAL